MSELEAAKDQLDERRIARGVALGLPLVTGVVALAVGVMGGIPIALLVLAAGGLLGAIALLWASLRVLSGDAALPPEIEALDVTAHGVDALASRKTMLLRALKDLENERALGKLEDDDYEPIAESYRNELKEVLRRIDESLEPYRGKAEAIAREHMERSITTKRAQDELSIGPVKVGMQDLADALLAGSATVSGSVGGEKVDVLLSSEPQRITCGSCEASNEPDAKFCKGCGAALSRGQTTEGQDES